MLFTTWDNGSTPAELSANFGGYEAISNKTKESITLKKKGQALLKIASKVQAPSLRFEKIQGSEFINWHFFDIISCKRKTHHCNFSPWPQTDNLRCPNYNTGITREKVKIEAPSRALLKWLQETTKTELRFESVSKTTEQVLDSMLLESRICPITKRVSKHHVTFKEMPSALEERLSNVEDEMIKSVAEVYRSENWHLVQKPMVQELSAYYMIDKVDVTVTRASGDLFAPQEWVVHTKLGGCDESIKRMKDQLFDPDSHPLDIYKLKLRQYEAESAPKQKAVSSVKTWKIPRESLKALEWSPLTRPSRLIAEKVQLWDNIENIPAKGPSWCLTFPILTYCAIDFIDMQKSLTTLTINVPKSPPTCIEDNAESVDMVNPINHELECMDDSSAPNTSLAPQATSFIDEDFKSLLMVKRRKLANDKEHDSSRSGVTQPLSVQVLRSLNERSHDRDSRGQRVSEPREASYPAQIIDPNATAFDPVDTPSSRRTILINLCRIRQNHRVVQFLSRTTGLQMIEQEQSLAWDFILNPGTCVVRFQLNKFFQMKPNNRLFYEDTLASLKAEFQKVIILLEYESLTEGADNDVFWKVRHFLSSAQFETHVTSNHHETIGKWICMLAQRYAHEYSDHAFDYTSDAETLLLALRLNRLQTKAILAKHQIADILLMVTTKDNGHLRDLTTASQRQRMLDLLLLAW